MQGNLRAFDRSRCFCKRAGRPWWPSKSANSISFLSICCIRRSYRSFVRSFVRKQLDLLNELRSWLLIQHFQWWRLILNNSHLLLVIIWLPVLVGWDAHFVIRIDPASQPTPSEPSREGSQHPTSPARGQTFYQRLNKRSQYSHNEELCNPKKTDLLVPIPMTREDHDPFLSFSSTDERSPQMDNAITSSTKLIDSTKVNSALSFLSHSRTKRYASHFVSLVNARLLSLS